jgi:hypothetical protein
MGIFSETLLGGAQQSEPQQPEGVGRFARVIQAKTPSFSDALLGPSQAQPEAMPEQPKAEDNRGWLRKGYDAVVGPKDPNYAGLPSVDEALQEEVKASGKWLNSPESRQVRIGMATAGDDKALSDITQKALGDRLIRTEKDANGYDVAVFKGADGSEKKAYVNKPGLDGEDVSRALLGAAPYAVLGALTGGIGPLAARTAVTGLGSAGTSIGMDLAATQAGSDQGVDFGRAAITGVLGAAGVPVGALLNKAWQRFVTVPGLFDRKAGALTDKGREAAARLGLEPDMLTGKIGQEFSKIYAAAPDTAKAQLAEQFSAKTLGIPSTVGQRSKDAEQLMRELSMRYGVYGENAKTIIQEFDKRQAEAVKQAAIGGATDPQAVQGIASKLAPHRAATELDSASLGQSIKAGLETAKDAAKQQERAAWSGVTDLTATKDALDMLPQSIGKSLGDFRVDRDTMPVAYSMAKKLEDYMTGKAAQEELKVLGTNAATPTIDEMRRRLGQSVRAAQNDADRVAAGRIYDGFNEWIGQAAEKQLLNGNPQAAAALRSARGFTKEMKDLFAPRDATGRTSAGGRLLSEIIDKADSPERVVSTLFFNSSQPSNIKSGGVEVLQKIKTILDKYPAQDVAKQTWDDIRTAYWLRLVQDKKGEMATPGVILSNIKTAIEKQGTVMKTLFSPEETAHIGQFIKALEQITYKDPNPSRSAVGAASLLKQAIGKIFELLGGNSRYGQMAVEYSGVGRAFGTASAKSALSDGIKAPVRGMGPEAAAISSGYQRSAE